MLRDRYYLGYVTYDGEEIEGRHDALIDEDLFEQVQDIIESRAVAGERRRVHHHYLKGSLFCGRCKRTAGITQRMTIQHTVNRYGTPYTYFFCRHTQDGACQAPHVNVIHVENAIDEHYATVRFSPNFVADVRAHILDAIANEETAARLLRQQLTSELRALDVREDNLIDLAADDTLPKAKIKGRLRDIANERRHLTERLNETTEDLSDSARLIEACLKLLENPQELYRRCDDEQRRLLNQAIFHGLYIEDDQVTDHSLKQPFAQLHRVQASRLVRSDKPDPGAPIASLQDASRAVSHSGGGPTVMRPIEALLRGIDLAPSSNKPRKVELWGFEPQTSSMPWRRATNCAIAPRVVQVSL